MNESPYASATTCCWHDELSKAGKKKHRLLGEVSCCPECGSDLNEYPSAADFWSMVKRNDSKLPGYEATLRWSQGKCYPDYDTLQNAYRQAMEGQS